jgi:YD repeat-containing protein
VATYFRDHDAPDFEDHMELLIATEVERMKRNAITLSIALLLATLATIGTAEAQQQVSAPQLDTAIARTVAAMNAVATRDAQGRIERFADTRGRPFVVTYDELGNVSSVRSPDRPNRLDVLGVAYTAKGELVTAMLGDGNVLVFSYDKDGTQYVQDRYGAVIRRMPTLDGYIVFSEDDQSGTLKSTTERLDSLLKVLATPSANE